MERQTISICDQDHQNNNILNVTLCREKAIGIDVRNTATG